MATYAIGDIQGCYKPLQQLLDKIAFNPATDRLWSAGDMVNRGPDSLAVLRFFKNLDDSAVAVLGNHDLHLLAVAHGNREKHRSSDTLDAVLQAPDQAELIEWLRQRPFLHHDSVLDYTLIHAGLAPQWDLAMARACAGELESALRGKHYLDYLQTLYGNPKQGWSNKLRGQARLQFMTAIFTRLRYCDRKGAPLFKYKMAPQSPTATQDTVYSWFEHPKRASRDCRLVFGHWATLGLYQGNNVIGLDSGCVWGGQLSALRLEDQQIFQVSCPQVCTPKAD